MKRKPISKARRFEVFKRDSFTCQYCGRTPPAVVLEVDHIVAVASGGSSDEHNLISSCFDCNRGKGSKSLEASPIDVSERAALLRERLEQTKEYESLLAVQRAVQEQKIDDVTAVFAFFFDGWTLRDSTRPSIRRFLENLPAVEVLEAMEMACFRMGAEEAFRYFCGICWRKIKGEAW